MAGFIFTAAAEVTVIAPVDVVIFIAASPAAISSPFIDDADRPVSPEPSPVTAVAANVPSTVKLPLVVTAPPSTIVIARSPSVKSIVAVFNDVPTVMSPDTSSAPFRSTVVVVISTSVSASISNWPSAEELIFKALSLNCNWLVPFKSTPASATWLRVTS